MTTDLTSITNITILILLRGPIIILAVITEAVTVAGIVVEVEIAEAAEISGLSRSKKRAVPGTVNKSQKGTALSLSFFSGHLIAEEAHVLHEVVACWQAAISTDGANLSQSETLIGGDQRLYIFAADQVIQISQIGVPAIDTEAALEVWPCKQHKCCIRTC